MFIDNLLELADATSVAGSAGTANIGDQIHIENVRDLGPGKPVYLVVTVDTSIVTASGAGTITFQLVSGDTASIPTNGTQTIHAVSPAFVTGNSTFDLAAGETAWVIALPYETQKPYRAYIGLQAVIATTAVSAGKINAFLTTDAAGWKAYADGI